MGDSLVGRGYRCRWIIIHIEFDGRELHRDSRSSNRWSGGTRGGGGNPRCGSCCRSVYCTLALPPNERVASCIVSYERLWGRRNVAIMRDSDASVGDARSGGVREWSRTHLALGDSRSFVRESPRRNVVVVQAKATESIVSAN